MHRRNFLSAAAALPAAMMAAQHRGETHVDTVRNGAPLQSGVVRAAALKPTGDSPGALARVHFNGPTLQLAALAGGLVMLEPGARPHPPHRHPEEEIVIVGEGSGEFSVEGVVTHVSAGDMMYAEGNVLHGIVNTGKTRMVFYFVKMQGRAG